MRILPIVLLILASGCVKRHAVADSGVRAFKIPAPVEVTGVAAITVEYAELIDGKCSICMREHRKSTVTMDGWASCTLMACAGRNTYDENGKPVPVEPCNTCSASGHCSNGHKIQHSYKQ